MSDLAKKVFELFGKPELVAEAESKPVEEQTIPSPAPWSCEHCGNPAKIEAGEPRRDDGVLLTYWHCEPCQSWGVTPATLRQPPTWVSKREQ